MPERTENNGACREERTGLHSLYLEGAFEGGCVTDFGMHAAPGEHARAWVETRRKREQHTDVRELHPSAGRACQPVCGRRTKHRREPGAPALCGGQH
ncbi:MAG: hypothetical protein GX234_11320, partial [Clostridiales bacterium]|nr:hypothetical protein [Clostridiales bacterium]